MKKIYNLFVANLGFVILIIFLLLILLVVIFRVMSYRTTSIDYMTTLHFCVLIGWLLCKYSSFKSQQMALEKEEDYEPDIKRSLNGLKDIIRKIIFKFYIYKKNQAFLVDILIHNQVVMQLLHRSHFPEVYTSENDISFGIALYLPKDGLNNMQIDILSHILSKEADSPSNYSMDDVDYYVIDMRRRVKYGGYILSRIIEEVFGVSDMSKLTYKVHDEGDLPYIGKKDIP